MGAGEPEPLVDLSAYQRLCDALTDPVFVLDVSQADAIRIVVANAACDSLFAVPGPQRVDRTLLGNLPPYAARRLAAECERCKTMRHPIELQLRLRAGDQALFTITLNVIEEGAEVRRIAVMARLASTPSGIEPNPSTERFRVIAEHAADYISLVDREGRILYANPAIERLTAPTFGSLIGKDMADWPPDLPHVERYRECIRRVVETGQPQVMEMDVPDPSSGQTVYHQIRYAPEWGPDGEVASIVGIGRDITALRLAEAELRKLNATLEERVAARTLDLEHANRDLRSFAWTVSHDLRAPLRAMRGYLTQLADDEIEGLSPRGRRVVERVAGAALKLEVLIDAVLAYSKAGQTALSGEQVAMTEVAREVVDELLPQPSSVRVDIDRLPAAYADVTMVRQIFQNLIGNALKFSADRKRSHVEVGWREQGGEIVYYVRDNGVGFDMQYAKKLFSIFERLHTEQEFPGSGVGLAIVKRLVERHGGRVWAESRSGAGATFYFTLSAQPQSCASGSPQQRSRTNARGGG